jgi:hypothetical protein
MRVTLAFILLAAACTSSNKSDTADVTKACNDVATANCNKRQTCSGNTNIMRAYGTMATCVEREALQCTISQAAPNTGATVTNLEACVSAYPAYSCEDFFNNNPPAACLVTGPKATNAPCAFEGQCSTTYCGDNKTAACGTCTAPPTAGASCRNSNCADGQSCLARTSICTVLGKVGQTCDADTQPCEFALYCQKALSTDATGTCVAETQESGQACQAGHGQCDASMGLVCNGATGARTCGALAFAADGQACGALATGPVACTQGDCYNAAGTIALAADVGTCKANAADGQPCDLDKGPACTSPARCVVSGGGAAGICTLPAGATCG